MRICRVEIANFRALERVSIPLQQFSVLLGENDVGKTSFLYALEKFFISKKLSDPKEWYRRSTDQPIRITVTFSDIPESDELAPFVRDDRTIVVNRIFGFEATPETKAILDDQSAIAIPRSVASRWFSENTFHFIPVRRDLGVQFSMNKTALLGKLLRSRMRAAIEEAGADQPLQALQRVMLAAIEEPRGQMEAYLRQQLNNDAIGLGFDDLEIDPTEGVKFSVTLSDDRIDGIEVQDRGAGTQNNLIIALFRLLANPNLAGEFIFAMEEPENSLHPKAQRQLLTVIQEISRTTQVIVTTHSPVFIDRSKFENNILLTRTLRGNTVAKVFDPQDLSDIRTDLGVRASDALLKGGGNCAVLIEGNTEEDGFPVFLEMLGLSEFELGIALINMGGSDMQKARSIVRLLGAYDISCVVVLDRDASNVAADLERMQTTELTNLRHIYCLSQGTIEDYYPAEIVANVINQELSPITPVLPDELDQDWSGAERLSNYKRVMHEHGAGSSIEYLKSSLGGIGTRMLADAGHQVPAEIEQILRAVEAVARE